MRTLSTLTRAPAGPLAQRSATDWPTQLLFNPRACLAVRFPAFVCTQCASACPTRALVAGAGGPRLSASCIDCGQCVPRCPTSALSLPGLNPALESATNPTDTSLTVDCWRVASAQSPTDGLRVPCLGGISPAWLLELMAAAPARPLWLLDRGLCATCPAGEASRRNATHPADWVLTQTARLLAGIGLAAERWPRRVQVAPSQTAQRPEPLLEARFSRRALFTGARGRSAPTIPPAQFTPSSSGPPRSTETARRRAALRRLAPNARLPGELFPALSIGPDCDQHGLCARACPSDALKLTRQPGEQGHRFSPGDCSACGLCVQLCPTQAIVLHPQGAPGCDDEPRMLSRFRTTACPVCGTETPGADPLCPNCARDRAFTQSAFRTLFAARGADP